MKRILILFVVAATVLVATIIWLTRSGNDIKTAEIVQFGVIFLIIALALFMGYRRIGSHKAGEPQEDEMSKQIMRKSSSISFYVSLYWWLAIGYFSEKLEYETHTVIGAGILGMAAIFAICWVIVYLRGIRNE
jgi:ACR3 family arsenite efflux pump ArsB